MNLSRRDQTILGVGVSVCGALLLLSSTITDGVGIAGIATLANRPPKEPVEPRNDDDA